MANKKPKGYMKYLFTIDAETTGLAFNEDDPSEGHQSVSWGIIVTDADTLTAIEELYVEIKWNDESCAKRESDPKFGKKAEEIHGLTKEHLDEHGISEQEAVEKIGSLIIKYWGPTGVISTLGHNVATFDVPFMRRLFRSQGIELKFANRHCDTHSIGFINWKTYTSDQLFDAVGFDSRGNHNSLEDAKQALEAARITRVIFDSAFPG